MVGASGEGSSAAAALWRLLLVLGFALVAGLNLPGHVPLDTLTALWEGRSHLRMSWGPPVYSAILGVFDAIAPGPGLFAAASMLLLFLAWAGLARLAPRLSWAAPVLLAGWLAVPQVLIFQGILWRDVLFANLAVAGFVALALAVARWRSPWKRWSLLGLTAICLALAALVRQNGGVVILAAALALAWTARDRKLLRAAAWGLAGLAAPLALALVLAAAAPVREPPGASHAIGVRLLAHYDLVSALAATPGRPLPHLTAARPKSVEVLRRQARRAYSPQRIDTIDRDVFLSQALWRFDTADVVADWEAMIASDPTGYAWRRLQVFRWVFLTPDLSACVPLHLGVSGLPQVHQRLGIPPTQWPQDGRLFAYAQRWYGTPFYSHLTYALLALGVAVFLILRRRPADAPMAALMVGALGFVASFLVLSIACDYRYLYFLDLAAITGTLYVALDPRLDRAAGGRGARRSG
jgi:hypothetical protein